MRVWRKIAQILNILLNKLILVDDLWFPRWGFCTSPANQKRKHNNFRWYWSRVFSSQWPNQDQISCPPVAAEQDLILVPCWFCIVLPSGWLKNALILSHFCSASAQKNRRPKQWDFVGVMRVNKHISRSDVLRRQTCEWVIVFSVWPVSRWFPRS